MIEALKQLYIFRNNLCGRWQITGTHCTQFPNPECIQIIEMPDSDGTQSDYHSLQS